MKIVRMDLRKMDELQPAIQGSLKLPYNNLRYIHNCLDRGLSLEQGYLASGVQLYNSNDITIRQNILVKIALFKYALTNCWFFFILLWYSRTPHSQM